MKCSTLILLAWQNAYFDETHYTKVMTLFVARYIIVKKKADIKFMSYDTIYFKSSKVRSRISSKTQEYFLLINYFGIYLLEDVSVSLHLASEVIFLKLTFFKSLIQFSCDWLTVRMTLFWVSNTTENT